MSFTQLGNVSAIVFSLSPSSRTLDFVPFWTSNFHHLRPSDVVHKSLTLCSLLKISSLFTLDKFYLCIEVCSFLCHVHSAGKPIQCVSADSLVAQMVKSLPAIWETWVQLLGQEDPLERDMATHSGVLAWRIPWVEESGRLRSRES